VAGLSWSVRFNLEPPRAPRVRYITDFENRFGFGKINAPFKTFMFSSLSNGEESVELLTFPLVTENLEHFFKIVSLAFPMRYAPLCEAQSFPRMKVRGNKCKYGLGFAEQFSGVWGGIRVGFSISFFGGAGN
jgi:hypothetical protein